MFVAVMPILLLVFVYKIEFGQPTEYSSVVSYIPRGGLGGLVPVQAYFFFFFFWYDNDKDLKTCFCVTLFKN